MADVPTWSQQLRVPSARVAGVADTGNAGQGLIVAGRAFGQAADVVDQMQERKAVVALNDARLTAAEKLFDIRQKYSTDTNYETLTDRHGQDVEQALRTITETLPDAPSQQAFGLSARRMQLSEREWAAGHQLTLQSQAGLATLQEGNFRTAQLAGQAPDDAGRKVLVDQQTAAIGDAMKAGIINPLQAQQLRSHFASAVDNVAAQQAILQDPRAALTALDDPGRFPNLTADARVMHQRRAEARVEALDREVERRRTKAEKEAEREAGIAFDQARVSLDELTHAAAGGRRLDPGEEADRLARVRGFAGFDAYRREALRDTAAAEQAIAVRDQVDRGIATNWEGGRPRSEAARALIDKLETRAGRDPLGLAEERGDVQLAPVDWTDPATLARRAQDSDRVMRLLAPLDPKRRYFTDAERDRLKAEIGAATPEQQMVMAASLQRGAGDRAGTMLDELEGAPKGFVWAGRLFLAGRVAAARDLLEGAVLMGKDPNAAGAPALREALSAELGGAFRGQPQQRADAIRAAEAIYLAGAQGYPDPASIKDGIFARRNLLNDAIQAAVGGERIAGAWWGGVTEHNGAKVVAPTWMRRDDFDTRIEKLTDADLAGLSRGGRAPTWPDGKAFTARHLEDAYLVAVGDGQYLVSATDPASEGASWIRGSGPDGLYLLDLTRRTAAEEAP